MRFGFGLRSLMYRMHMAHSGYGNFGQFGPRHGFGPRRRYRHQPYLHTAFTPPTHYSPPGHGLDGPPDTSSDVLPDTLPPDAPPHLRYAALMAGRGVSPPHSLTHSGDRYGALLASLGISGLTPPGPPGQDEAPPSGLTPPGLFSPHQPGSLAHSPRALRIGRTAIGQIAREEALRAGFDPHLLMVMIDIESGGRPGVRTGSYCGLLQLSQSLFTRHGGTGSIFDPRQNIRAGIRLLQERQRTFRSQFGRDPSATELYLAHQQGPGGIAQHLARPDRLAWQSMHATGEGRNRGPGWARRAIWGNVPTTLRHLVGSVERITSAQFMAIWTNRVEGTNYHQALARIQSGQGVGSLLASGQPSHRPSVQA